MSRRGRSFEAGNRFGRGRPRGSRNKTSKATKELLDSNADALVRKAIAMAKRGDPSIMRALLDRVAPVQRETPVKMRSLRMATITDLVKASEQVLKKVTSGKITIKEGEGLANLIKTRCKAIETEELEQRVTALEEKKRQ